jgi:hypothetical protein
MPPRDFLFELRFAVGAKRGEAGRVTLGNRTARDQWTLRWRASYQSRCGLRRGRTAWSARSAQVDQMSWRAASSASRSGTRRNGSPLPMPRRLHDSVRPKPLSRVRRDDGGSRSPRPAQNGRQSRAARLMRAAMYGDAAAGSTCRCNSACRSRYRGRTERAASPVARAREPELGRGGTLPGRITQGIAGGRRCDQSFTFWLPRCAPRKLWVGSEICCHSN